MSTGLRSFDRGRERTGVSRRRERELSGRIREGCGDSLDELVRANLAFVASVARRYIGLGLAFEDLVSSGAVGLIEAARRYDPDRGTRFLTYAHWWIRKTMLHALCETAHTVRVPDSSLRRLRASAAENGSRDLGLPKRISLDQRDEHNGRTMAEVLPADPGDAPDLQALRRESAARVGRALTILPEKERFVIVHRFGFGVGGGETLQGIADRLGISRERVRQIERTAMSRLRRYLRQHGS